MLILFGVFVDLALGARFPGWPLGAPTVTIWAALFGTISIWGGGMEEIGWRGFALPRLQKLHSPLIASLIIGAFWALWHLPLYFNGQYTAASNTGPAALAGILFRFEWSLPLSVIFTWVYNRANGSLLIMVLFHVLLDLTTAVVPISYRAGAITFLGTFWAVAIVIILRDHMWRGLHSKRRSFRC
jgi:membrane protease YdiL (CAAX protease family)